MKDLIVENSDVKQTLSNALTKLNLICKQYKMKEKLKDKDDEKENYELLIDQLPFENISLKLDEYVKIKFQLIEERLNGESCLNTTFTIEDENSETDCNSSDASMNKSINISNNNKSKNTSVNNANNTTNASDIDYLKFELDEYKKVIQTQNELINTFNQSITINTSANESCHNNNKSIASFIEVEATSLIEERLKLAEEKKYYYKQKLQFEEEKLSYNQALLHLSKQVS